MNLVPKYFFSRVANRLLRPLGAGIRPLSLDPIDVYPVLFGELGTQVVLDVGANVGQYAILRRHGGFLGTIVSFEPQSAAFAELRSAKANDAKWLLENCALGPAEGEIELNIAGNSLSSSVLPMLEMHASNAPTSSYVGTERVRQRALDDVVDELQLAGRMHLKIDVQGFEDAVLRGAVKTLERCDSLELELSFAPLYDGQPDYLALLGRLADQGFDLYDMIPGFRAASGRLLQIDGIFVRTSALN